MIAIKSSGTASVRWIGGSGSCDVSIFSCFISLVSGKQMAMLLCCPGFFQPSAHDT